MVVSFSGALVHEGDTPVGSVGIFTDLHGKYNSLDRVRIQLGPANLHWCSDACLKMLRDHATRYKSPMHMHLLETVYQKEYARRRTGMTAVAYLKEFDLLGPDMTLGHGTYVLDGEPRMRERPIGDLVLALRELGADVSPLAAEPSTDPRAWCPPLRIVAAGLPGGTTRVAGDISSQYLSALLMVAPYAGGGATIEVEGEYIPAAKAMASNKNGAAAVVHFTHMPCGYAVIAGKSYR